MSEWGTTIVAGRVGEEEPLRRPLFEDSSSEELDVVAEISELSLQELKLCLKEPLSLFTATRKAWVRYGVIKFNELERREQLVKLLEKVDSWPCDQSGGLFCGLLPWEASSKYAKSS